MIFFFSIKHRACPVGDDATAGPTQQNHHETAAGAGWSGLILSRTRHSTTRRDEVTDRGPLFPLANQPTLASLPSSSSLGSWDRLGAAGPPGVLPFPETASATRITVSAPCPRTGPHQRPGRSAAAGTGRGHAISLAWRGQRRGGLSREEPTRRGQRNPVATPRPPRYDAAE